MTIAREKDLAGVRVTVTAGPTQEALDPVRYLTNHSTGKMGYAIAREAALRGAEVTLISGPVSLKTPAGVHPVAAVSAQDMFEAVKAALPETDILVMSAAVADYRPASVAADIIVGKKPGNQNGTVKISQKIAGKNDNDYAQNHAYCSSLSPFWRMVMRTGVPMRSKTSRIWFSRYR